MKPPLKIFELQAIHDRARHTKNAQEVAGAKQELSQKTADVRNTSFSTAEQSDGVLRDLGAAVLKVSRTEDYLEESVSSDNRNYQGLKDKLHEIALMDAHMDGVVINVEQPLEIGQKIDVQVVDPADELGR